jgi:SAM-dependent methyltransferase
MKSYRAIAEYYDAENASHRVLEEDVPFFLGQLPNRRQKILELAVGTARAAIPIAQAGHQVVGVDYAADMLAIARRKRDVVGLTDRELRLVQADCLDFNLCETFDWICVFFNTFCAFTTLKEQDRVLQGALRHLKPRGRFWLDIYQPDLKRLARPAQRGLTPTLFHVPHVDRTVLKTTDLVQHPERQAQRVTFNYQWIGKGGQTVRRSRSFDLAYIFPRELRVLLERNGLRIEHLWGNYDAGPINANSPRMIARCCRM